MKKLFLLYDYKTLDPNSREAIKRYSDWLGWKVLFIPCGMASTEEGKRYKESCSDLASTPEKLLQLLKGCHLYMLPDKELAFSLDSLCETRYSPAKTRDETVLKVCSHIVQFSRYSAKVDKLALSSTGTYYPIRIKKRFFWRHDFNTRNFACGAKFYPVEDIIKDAKTNPPDFSPFLNTQGVACPDGSFLTFTQKRQESVAG